jgi:CelD/BcsL family acetyltransferase involved in cellulose biosynthesis
MVQRSQFSQFQEAIEARRFAPAPIELGTARLVWRSPDQLTPLDRIRWDDLANSGESPNPFAQPWFLTHALNSCDPEKKVRLLVVEDVEQRWLGVLPVCHARYNGRTPLPHWQVWHHPNQFLGTPLIRTQCAESFWRTVLDDLAETARGKLALCLTDLPLDDPVVQGLLAVCDRDGRGISIQREFERALLRTDNPPALKPKHRRRLDTLQRKLAADLGEVRFYRTRDPGEIAATIDDFLELERRGWKGAGGSALACQAGTAALFAGVARDGADRGCFELATLHAGGRLLAVSSQLIDRSHRYGFKMAYDETASAYAPGLLLLNWITAELCQIGRSQLLDSCAAPGQEPVSRLWHDRTRLVDCRIALGGPLRRGALRLVMAGEAAYWFAKTLGKP